MDALQSEDLTAEQERTLALQAQAGSKQAERELVAANFRHVKAIALRYGAKNADIDADDLVSEGLAGLAKAIHKFDVTAGTRFITYAAYWIRAGIMLYMMNNRSAVHGGGGMVRSKNFFRMRREAAKMMGAGVAYDDVIDSLQRRFNISSRLTVESELVRVFSRDVYLDEVGEDGKAMLDTLPSGSNPEAHSAQHERAEAIRESLNQLDPRERAIIERTYLQAEDTFANIGRDMGVSRERVRQLQTRAIGKLRGMLGHLN